MTAALDKNGLLCELGRQVAGAGSQSAFSRKTGIPLSQISEALSGRRQVSGVMANAMGFAKVDRWVLVRRVKVGAST